jgi:hypothetical protein
MHFVVLFFFRSRFNSAQVSIKEILRFSAHTMLTQWMETPPIAGAVPLELPVVG